MINFQPDTCLPKDPSGFGLWLSNHYLEHRVFQLRCLNLTPSIQIPDYDFLSWRDEPQIVQSWLVDHEQVHQQLRVVCNVDGADLSLVDFSKDDEFLDWMNDHASEHQYFRQALNIT